MYQLLPYGPPSLPRPPCSCTHTQTSLSNLHPELDVGTEEGKGQLGDPGDPGEPHRFQK